MKLSSLGLKYKSTYKKTKGIYVLNKCIIVARLVQDIGAYVNLSESEASTSISEILENEVFLTTKNLSRTNVPHRNNNPNVGGFSPSLVFPSINPILRL